jgi:hypothetical protein
MATIEVQEFTINKPNIERGIDLKMATLPRMSCNTVTGKIPIIVLEQLKIHPFTF